MKGISVKSQLITLSAIVALGLIACVIIPTPLSHDKISEEDIAEFTQGVTTIDDVLRELGDPDVILNDKNQHTFFVYKWDRLRASILLVGLGAAELFFLTSDEALLVQFDDNYRIKKTYKPSKLFGDTYEDFINRCLKEMMEKNEEK